MRKALRHANVGVQEMAIYLDVDRSTVSTWLSGRIEPRTQTLRLWAFRTGVSFAWLVTGDPDDDPEHVTAGVRKRSFSDSFILTFLVA
jgi:transcriptional regulator with XRE-family HTH domain